MGHYRLSREAQRGFFMLENSSFRLTGCTSSSSAAASTLKCCCGSVAADPLSPDTTTLQKHLKKKQESWRKHFHSSTMPVWKCVMNKKNNASNKKNQKLLQVLKVFYILQCFFSCLHHPSIPLFLLFIWLLVTPLTQWGYMIVIKITRATGLLPLKAWTIIPYTEEVKVWLTIWFRGHLSYISVLVTTGLAPSIYKQMSSNHNNYFKKATLG